MKTLLTRFRLWLAVKIMPLPQIQVSANLFEVIPPAVAQSAPTSKLDEKYAPNITINKVTISDRGDASVGINGGWWELDLHGLEIDGDNLELLRADLRKMYSAWNEFPADDVEFDFETEKRLQAEREHDEYVDYCATYEGDGWREGVYPLNFAEWRVQEKTQAQQEQEAKYARAYAEMLFADPAPFDDAPVSVPMLAAAIFMLFVIAIMQAIFAPV